MWWRRRFKNALNAFFGSDAIQDAEHIEYYIFREVKHGHGWAMKRSRGLEQRLYDILKHYHITYITVAIEPYKNDTIVYVFAYRQRRDNPTKVSEAYRVILDGDPTDEELVEAITSDIANRRQWTPPVDSGLKPEATIR